MTGLDSGLAGGLDGGLPRVDLVIGPTPLRPAPRLSGELGVPVLLKRDDLTGTGLGGNKLRGLEFLIADALARGCDSLVTGAGPQSNWTMLAALSCLRHGLEPHIVCYGTGAPAEGNMRLHRWLGVDVRFTGSAERASVEDGIQSTAAELRAAGRRPYPVPRGGATPLGALGYVRASAELAGQFGGLPEPPAALWLATGSCGTQAGLVAGLATGLAAGGPACRVTGVTVSRPAAECRARIGELAAGAARLAGLDAGIPEPDVREGWMGPGYGQPSEAGEAAARLVAATEGVFLDPVFAAKAMAALIDSCRRGLAGGTQVFLVTGGAPTLFAGPLLGPPNPAHCPPNPAHCPPKPAPLPPNPAPFPPPPREAAP